MKIYRVLVVFLVFALTLSACGTSPKMSPTTKPVTSGLKRSERVAYPKTRDWTRNTQNEINKA